MISSTFRGYRRVLIGRLTLESESFEQICVFRIIDCYLWFIVVRISGVVFSNPRELIERYVRVGEHGSSISLLVKVLAEQVEFSESRLTTFQSCNSKLSIGIKYLQIHFLFISIGKVFSARSPSSPRGCPLNECLSLFFSVCK